MLLSLEIQNVRNLKQVKLDCAPGFNLVQGINGSGKTSLLEAIHLLGLARSFRTHIAKRVIQYDTEQFSVFGRLKVADRNNPMPIGIARSRDGQAQLRLDGEAAEGAAALAEYLPLQLIHPNSHHLLEEGPKLRRQFLDWGVFHVEHGFLPAWQQFNRLLKQRNAALRMGAQSAQIQHWNEGLVPLAESLDEMRRKYIAAFTPVFLAISTDLQSLGDDVSLSYERGWPADTPLAELLEANIDKDSERGYTYYGPQRADLSIRVGGILAQHRVSRGQQKLLVCALRLAQGMLLKELTGKSCLYLVDDLAAELDSVHLQRIVQRLSNLESQVFITGVDTDPLSQLLNKMDVSHTMFHVEHGVIEEVCIS